MGTIVENPYAFGDVGGMNQSVVNPTPVASAAAMPAPLAQITTVSGAAAISTIALPWPGFTGAITLIPTGAFTMATGGTADAVNKPIGKAMAAATVGLPITVFFDGNMWYPK